MADRSNVTNSGKTKDGSKFVVKRDIPVVNALQNRFTEMINKFKTFALVSSSEDDDTLKDMSDKISIHTYSYLQQMKSTTGDDITRFLNKTLQSSPTVMNNMMGIKTAEDLLNNDGSNFQAFFFERYKNINNRYEDLRIITEYLYELEEAVTTMRDNITGADDLVSMISREISFGSSSTDKTDDKKTMISAVEKIEKEYGLKEKLKNIIVPRTLIYGNFFVYTIPYKDVFAQFEYRRKMDNTRIGGFSSVGEAFIHPTIEGYADVSSKYRSKNSNYNRHYSAVIESLTSKYNETVDSKNQKTKEEIYTDIKEVLEGISICNEDSFPMLEENELAMFANDAIKDQALKDYRKYSKPSNTAFWEKAKSNDAVVDLGEPDKESQSMYKDISGVYIKLYDPDRVIPVYVMDSCIGYYVLYETFGEIRNSILLNSSLNRTNIAYADTKKKQLNDEVINVIASAICDNIDKKYVASNPKFKELIVNAISFQDFYKKKFKIQFVPVNYMTHFKINEDSNTHMGVSVLNKSLFYAKLYLSLLLFKIITILTKSNDMRIYYIRNAGINKNMVNKVQEIARGIKDKQISFNDLASIQTIFSKVGAYKEAFIPMGKSGEKNIEFDILSGQDVQLNTELMELLRKGMINNSGVPSIILSYMEEADFAKTLVMQHAKYLARIISLQTELEANVTEWYKKILTFNTEIKEEYISDFNFTFTRPKSLNTQDMTDLIANAEALGDFITKMMVDENNAELTAAYKQELIKSDLLRGVFHWNELNELLEKVTLDLKQKKKFNEIVSNGEGE